MRVTANGLAIEVEDSGPGTSGPERPAVILIMGLGMQLVAWPPPLVQALVEAGFRVIRFDNRDAGLSQHFDDLGRPHLIWQSIRYRLGLTPRAPYSLADMATDTLGVLDALGIARAHVVGVSMGGMIAQRLALMAPQRCLSLTSIMSSSGARGLPQARPEVLRVLLSRPNSASQPAVLAHYLRLFRVIGSPEFPIAEEELAQRILLGLKRGGYHPDGTLRQLMAVMADGQRARQLKQLRVPTLVLHGRADPLVPIGCGEDTARRIPGAKFVGIEGLGHDLPPGALTHLLTPLITHMKMATPVGT